MTAVLHALVVYLMLMVLFRITGKRSLGQATTFDFVLLLIISEAVSSALLADDHSITGATIAVLTLVCTDIAFSLAKQRWPAFGRLVEGEPVWLVRNGVTDDRAMEAERVDDDDLLEAARLQQGITSLRDVDEAVVERGGEISVVPRKGAVKGEDGKRE
ncbi:MAG: YetF domain-containing protein [Gemmatimonadota bacterium]